MPRGQSRFAMLFAKHDDIPFLPSGLLHQPPEDLPYATCIDEVWMKQGTAVKGQDFNRLAEQNYSTIHVPFDRNSAAMSPGP